MRQIRFRFNPEKLVHALVFFSTSGVKNLDTMKAAKLLYFADRLHLQKYGRPILGDDYYCMKHGPIPTLSLNIMQAAIQGSDEADDAELLVEYLEIERSSKYPQFIAKKDPDMDVFSDSDVEVLQNVVAKYGGKTAWQLRELAHEQPEVKTAEERRLAERKGSVPMPFESFFDAAEDAMLALMQEDQDSRDFVQSLTW